MNCVPVITRDRCLPSTLSGGDVGDAPETVCVSGCVFRPSAFPFACLLSAVWFQFTASRYSVQVWSVLPAVSQLSRYLHRSRV